jgi:large subunit ribosomal protein L29
MTGEEVRKLTDEELGVELKRLRGRVYQLRTQAVSEKVEDNTEIRRTRRDVARILTETRARQLAGAAGK